MRSALPGLLVLLSCTLFAQQVEISRYDLEQGLPQSMVNHVLQAHDGFIWLGTGDGLARFDGQRFVVYKNDPLDSMTISHNTIWGLAEQDATHLWVGTRAGLDLLDRRTGRFAHVNTGAAVKDGCWLPIGPQGDTMVFYSALQRALLYMEQGHAHRVAKRHIDAYAMRLSADGRTLQQVLRPDTLLTIDLHNGHEEIRVLPVKGDERVDGILQIGHRWLVLTNRGGWLWNGGSDRVALPSDTRALLEQATGHKVITRAPDGTLWLGISGVGVITLNADLTVRDRYPLLPPAQRPLNVTTLAFDRQGNTWVGTDGKGVFTIAPQRILFGRCMPGQGLAWEPPSWFTLGFAQWDSAHVLVSLYQGGLALFDERSARLEPLVLPELGSASHIGELRMLTNDRAGRVWSKEGLVVRAFDPVSGRLVYECTDTCGALIGRSLVGDVLLGSVCTPLLQVNGSGGAPGFATLEASALHAHLDSLHNMPQRMVLDDDQRVWISSEVMPLSVWSSTGRVPFKIPAPALFDPLTRMTDLAADGGDLWMTSDQGLLRWRAKDLTLLGHYTVHDGLPDQFLYALLPSEGGTWWISSNKGLSRFDPQDTTFSNYTPSDGLQSTEFNSHAAFRSASGRLYFGGVNGFNHFLPGTSRTDPDTADVRLIGLTVQDSTLDVHALGETPVILLRYGRNAMRIEVAVLEFSAPHRNAYRYRIPGYAEWTTNPPDRPITLTNMPAGDYAVEVAGVNGHGLVSAPRTLLAIHVPLPFWASPWAFLLAGSLLVAIVAGIGFLLYSRRVKQRLRDAEQQMKELRVRTRLALDLHDDVGSGLARIAALARMAEKRTTRGDASTEQVSKMATISQDLMDNLRDVVWVNEPRNGELADLLLRLKEHIRDLFEPNGVQCVFHLPEPLPERTIGSSFKRNAFLIMKEAAHNAGKYSGTTRLEFAFTLHANGFTCSLRDHGKGLGDGTVQGSGHGFINLRERAAELGAVLTIGDVQPSGTAVVLTGPLTCLDL